jgi:peptide/nickel transport system substrate-binding protein
VTTRKYRRALVAVVTCVGVVAGACAGDDDSASDTTLARTDANATTSAGSGAPATTTGGEGDATTSSAAEQPPEEQPTPGGKLTMGVEADTAQPWTPANMACASSCYQVIRSVYDSLTHFNVEGDVEPYLAESVEPNADYTVWSITARSGVKFHDGTPLDGAALADNLQRHQKSILTGIVLADVLPDGIAVSPEDPMTVVITLRRPWVDFPVYLTSQIGLVASPTWLATVDADPTKATQPVGTGPFVFASYTPGESFRATKNPEYWNQPYPYLDEVEFRIVVDGLTRQRALEAGDVDIMQTSTGSSIADFRDNADEFPMLEYNPYGESSFTMINTDSENPALSDRRVRCALANAQDIPALIEVVQDGVNAISNGPFAEDTPGYLADTGYPTEQNMELAQQLIAEYKAEYPGSISITLSTTPDQQNQTIAQAQAEWFREAGIDDVQISTYEQGVYILQAIFGDFELFQWRGGGAHVLDSNYIWWHSTYALPRGELALNFSRIKDPVLDEALDANRGETDPDARRANAETVSRQFGQECYNLWSWRTQWALPHRPEVKGLDDLRLPSGSTAAVGVPVNGTFSVASAWLQH